MKFRSVIFGALTAATLLTISAPSFAQAWPSRPVKIIVSQAAGAALDILARQIADKLSTGLGQPVIVENRPGAGNTIGAQAAAKSQPDGYTFFLATAAALVTNPLTFKSLPYQPDRDFSAVSLVGKGPFFLLAHPSLPVDNLRDLIALDKKSPGNLAFASDGTRGFAGMLGEWLNKSAGTQFRQIPYTVTTQGLQDTVGNTTPLTVQAVGVAASFLKSGGVKAIAVSSSARVSGFENVPTIAVTLPGFEVNGWFILAAPSGTPNDVIRRMNAEMNKVLSDPVVIARMRDFGIVADAAGTPENAAKFVQAEKELWTRLTRSIGIEPE